MPRPIDPRPITPALIRPALAMRFAAPIRCPRGTPPTGIARMIAPSYRAVDGSALPSAPRTEDKEMLLGVIADDLTGATDVALTLSRNGMKTVEVIGVPTPDQEFSWADAVVVALKSRTIPAAEAIAMSLEAAAALRSAGAEQFLFKYCSTFDSTDARNIGPVAEAVL